MRQVVLTSEVEKFIVKQKILVADTSKSARVGIARALCDLGAKNSLITLVDSYVWAEQIIKQTDPGLIVLDYHLDAECGIDLLQRESATDPRVTVVVTQNSSQAAVARAAECDVDAYITKPYTLKIFNESVTQAIARKLNPTEYVKTINTGRQLLRENKAQDAIKAFDQAMKLDSLPSLACYYKGFTHQLDASLAVAEQCYAKGLEFNSIHYKCLLGLHEALIAQHKGDEAYEILRRMFQNFPLNQTRFKSLVRLSVQNQRFNEAEDYYDSFLLLDLKTEETIRCICAAMITAGKHFLLRKQHEIAFRLFQKAGVSAGNRVGFLKEIILALAEDRQADEMDKFLRRFPPETRSTADFQALDYLALSLVKSVGEIVTHGRKLVQKYRDPLIYRILVQSSVQAGFPESAQEFAREASRHWPEKKSEFEALLSTPTKELG